MRLSPEEKITLFRSLFRGREDVFARRWEKWDGGVSGYSPIYKNWKKKDDYEPLTGAWVEKHLRGTQTLGVYPLLQDNTSWFIAADFDGKDWLASCRRFYEAARTHKLPVYMECSRSGNGGHVWCFFAEPYPAYKSRQIFFNLLRASRNIDEFDKDDSFDRLFPNQDFLSGKGLGNLIALPLQGQSRKDGNTVFLDPEQGLGPAADQWEFLTRIARASVDQLNALWAACSEAGERPVKPARLKRGGSIVITLAEHASIHKSDIIPPIANFLRNELNFFNSEYLVKQRMGLAVYNVEKYFRTISTKGEEIRIPRGFLPHLIEYLKEHGYRFGIVDNRHKAEPVAFKPTYTLHDYQQKAVATFAKKDCGVLVAPPGSGKTIMGLEIIAQKRQPTLILTHRAQIFNQWLQSIEGFLGIPKKNIGQYASLKKQTASPITVGMVQTLSRVTDFSHLSDAFGLVLVDECHHMPARMFRDVVTKFNPY